MKVCFLDLSTKLETIDDLKTRARGGMVTSLFKVSDYLSQQGIETWVVSDVRKGGITPSGTRWITDGSQIPSQVDFLITNRGTSDGFSEINAKHRILWTHDLPHAGFIPNPKTIRAYSATVFMSRYAERVWRDFYRDIGRSFFIPNGVDKSIFYPREKDLNYLMFASAPNRGLKRLPFIFDAIESRVKKPIYMRAFSNLKALHPNETRNEEQDGFALIYREVAESRVDLKDPVPQGELAEELGRAGLMILPTDYPEICSNIVLQALACGVPVVTTGNLGSACEWVKHDKNGKLTSWHPVDYMVYQVDLIRQAVNILEDEDLHRKLIINASNSDVMTWDQIGALWKRMLEKLL